MTVGEELSGNCTEWKWTTVCASWLGSQAFCARPTCLSLTGKLSLHLSGPDSHRAGSPRHGLSPTGKMWLSWLDRGTSGT